MSRRSVIAIAAVVLDAILIATRSGGPLPVAITFILAVWGVWRLIKLAFQRTRLIWQLRNRLIVTYVFIAVVPIMLILALVFVGGFLLTGEIESYLAGTAFDRRNIEIENAAVWLAKESPADMLTTTQQLTASGIPQVEALVTGTTKFRYPANSDIAMPPDGWKDYTGLVYKDGHSYLMALVTRGANRALVMRSFTLNDQANLMRGLGTVTFPLPSTQRRKIVSSRKEAGVLPPAYNAFDLEVPWYSPVDVAQWDSPGSPSLSAAVLSTRPSAVLAIVSRTEITSAEGVLDLFYILAALLGVAWLISLYIGIAMTRNITGAVNNLYEGTTRIGEGDFEHDIPVKGTDQLADLGRSFNKMAVQLEQFVVVTREKERLQSEIAIASEVQTKLFPHYPPSAKTIEMLGVCHAARSVSGDYYDYFTAADGELALALGDVAGKGISAALLMASIQSIMRTQLCDGNAAVTPANTVARLNRLLYASTSPEKYATFFFGLYSEQTRRLRYTNAGHLPPLLIHGDRYEFLEVTGSVVGAFPMLRYEEQSVPLGCGDLLVAYTDGITEPENAYGEDFGAERLADVVMRHRNCCPDEIVAKVLEAVRHWDTSEEQADDMTLMIVRGVGMKVLTVAQMNAVDRATVERGIPDIILMENAAHRVVEYIESANHQRIVVVCGKGNNGGDGLAIARILHTRFRPELLEVVLVGDPHEQQLKMLNAAGLEARRDFTAKSRTATLVVDAVLGTGLSGPARGAALDAIRAINTQFPFAKVVAVDIPSGLAGDSATPVGEYVRADATVTFTAPKICHALPPARGLMGDLRITQIGSPEELLEESQLELITPQGIASIFAPRDRDSNKGRYGHVLVIAGSRGKPGAAAMAGIAALRAGAGLVTVACPESLVEYSPELMTEPIGKAHELAAKLSLTAIGPGIGTEDETRELVRTLYATLEKPMVVDADALNCLVGSEWKRPPAPRILTPHPGEMSRLTGLTIPQVQADRIGIARAFATERGVTLVLKGEGTVIAFPDGRVWINTTGSPAMATGGTGDILTGMTAGLAGQFPKDLDRAVAAAVYVHGLAGELAARHLCEQPVIATDLLRYLPEGIRAITNVSH